MSEAPYVIVDASFVLRDLTGTPEARTLDAAQFLQRCKYLAQPRWQKLRMLPQIRGEVVRIVEPYLEQEEVKRGVQLIRDIPCYPRTPSLADNDFFRFFIDKMRTVSEKLDRRNGKEGLSDNDVTYGAYCLVKTTKNDVIAATHDYLLMDTIYHIHTKVHPILAQRRYHDSALKIAEDIPQLEDKLQEIRLLRAVREKKECKGVSKEKIIG